MKPVDTYGMNSLYLETALFYTTFTALSIHYLKIILNNNLNISDMRSRDDEEKGVFFFLNKSGFNLHCQKLTSFW